MRRLFIIAVTFFFISNSFAESDAIKILNMQATQTASIFNVNGTAQNISGKLLKTVFIEFNLYDEQGSLVGNSIATVSNLGAGVNWKFNASSPIPFSKVTVSAIRTYDN